MKLTKVVLLAVGVLLLGYEGWALFNGVPGDLISEAVWDAMKGRPFIPFLAGFLAGHLFWQKRLEERRKQVDALQNALRAYVEDAQGR